MSKFVYTGQDNLKAMLAAKNYNKYLVSFVLSNLRKGKVRILDFGAGIGTYADILKGKGVIVDCFEIDEKQVEMLRKKGYQVYDDMDNLPNDYDIIYSFNVFEHIEDDEIIHTKLSKLLRTNGTMITYVPAFPSLYSAMDTLVEHQRRYTLSMLRSLARASELKILKAKYCDPLGYLTTLIYKIIGNKDGVITKKSVVLYDRIIFPVSLIIENILRPPFGKNAVLILIKEKK